LIQRYSLFEIMMREKISAMGPAADEVREAEFGKERHPGGSMIARLNKEA
jgi:hypothetical protein